MQVGGHVQFASSEPPTLLRFRKRTSAIFLIRDLTVEQRFDEGNISQ